MVNSMLDIEVDKVIIALKDEKLDEIIAKHFRETKKQFSFSEGAKRLITLLENFKQTFGEHTPNCFWYFYFNDLKPYKNEKDGTSYLQANFHSTQHEGYTIRATTPNCNYNIGDDFTIFSNYAIGNMEHQRNYPVIEALLKEVDGVSIQKKCGPFENDWTSSDEKKDLQLYFRVNFLLSKKLFPQDAIAKVDNLVSVVQAYRKHLGIETKKVTQYAKQLLDKKA